MTGELALPRTSARERLLKAAVMIVRQKGFAATSVDDLCRAANVTKGAFFHHFESKEALGVAAADHWSLVTGAFFEAAPYHQHADALDRVLGYLDFRKDILLGTVPEFTCLVGTMVQEVYDAHPSIREACEASISGHAAKVEADLEEAMCARGLDERDAKSLALHMQAVLQGSFILAKAKGDASVVGESLAHLRRYVELMFRYPSTREA